MDQVVQHQQQHYQQGFQQGLQDGLAQQAETYKKEAFNNGREIADELGYYLGLTMAYRAAYHKIVDHKKHSKLENIMDEVQSLINNFELGTGDHQVVQPQVDKIRAKVKLMAIHMGMKYSVEQ